MAEFVRGTVLFMACFFLFAIGGGVVAGILDAIAPRYYPVMFPGVPEGQAAFAAVNGVVTGIIQGSLIGLLVGIVIPLGLGYLRQLSWLSCLKALVILAGLSLLFGVVGGTLGYLLGRLAPGYYHSMFNRENEHASFSPTDVGIGLGGSQGMMIGVAVACVLVLALAWRRSTIKSVENSPLVLAVK